MFSSFPFWTHLPEYILFILKQRIRPGKRYYPSGKTASSGEAWKFVEALLASPSFGLLVPGERHAAVVPSVIKESAFLQGNLVLDAQTAILMREHGIRKIYTRDTDFHRFRFLEPVDPTT